MSEQPETTVVFPSVQRIGIRPSEDCGQPITVVNVPVRIWLQTGTAVCDSLDGETLDFNDLNSEDLTWCQDEIEYGDIEFIRADVAQTQLDAAVAKAAEKARREAWSEAITVAGTAMLNGDEPLTHSRSRIVIALKEAARKG